MAENLEVVEMAFPDKWRREDGSAVVEIDGRPCLLDPSTVAWVARMFVEHLADTAVRQRTSPGANREG